MRNMKNYNAILENKTDFASWFSKDGCIVDLLRITKIKLLNQTTGSNLWQRLDTL